jgi:hypothetical protein
MVQDPYIFQVILFPNIYVVQNTFISKTDCCGDKNDAGLEVTVVKVIKCPLNASFSTEPRVICKALEVYLRSFLTFGTKWRRVSGSSYKSVYFHELRKTWTFPFSLHGKASLNLCLFDHLHNENTLLNDT